VPIITAVGYGLIAFVWLRAAFAPMVIAVGRAIRNPREWWPAPLFALAPLVIWTAIGVAAVMIVVTGVPNVADTFAGAAYRTGLLAGAAAWLLLVFLRGPGFRWPELEWPLARDARHSVYARFVPVNDRPPHSTGVGRLIRAATALKMLWLT
jgi:hypothetical protein